MQAVLEADLQLVQAALEAGGDPNAIDGEVGHSALHVAVTAGGPRDRAIVEQLLRRNVRLARADGKTGMPPLAAALVVTEQGPFASLERTRAANIVELLLQRGADPNQRLSGAETPLMLAVSQNNLPAVRALLANGARPNLTDANGSTALHVAYATQRATDMLSALVDAGADPGIRDAAGRLPREIRIEPAAAASAAPAPGQAPAPVPQEPPKSSMNKWLIGGAVAAAAVVGAVVIAHHMKEQKKKRQPAPGVSPAPLPTVPTIPPVAAPPAASPAPVVPPTPVVPSPPVPSPPAVVPPQPAPPVVAPPQPIPPAKPVEPPLAAPPVAPAPPPTTTPDSHQLAMERVRALQIVSQAFQPLQPEAGKPYVLAITLRNAGTSALNGIRLRLRDPRLANDIADVWTDLAPGEQKSVPLAVSAGSPQGRFSPHLLVNPNLKVKEINPNSVNMYWTLKELDLDVVAKPVAAPAPAPTPAPAPPAVSPVPSPTPAPVPVVTPPAPQTPAVAPPQPAPPATPAPTPVVTPPPPQPPAVAPPQPAPPAVTPPQTVLPVKPVEPPPTGPVTPPAAVTPTPSPTPAPPAVPTPPKETPRILKVVLTDLTPPTATPIAQQTSNLRVGVHNTSQHSLNLATLTATIDPVPPATQPVVVGQARLSITSGDRKTVDLPLLFKEAGKHTITVTSEPGAVIRPMPTMAYPPGTQPPSNILDAGTPEKDSRKLAIEVKPAPAPVVVGPTPAERAKALQFVDVAQDPKPALPGKPVAVTVSLKNAASFALENVSVVLHDPIAKKDVLTGQASIKAGDQAKVALGSFPTGQAQTYSVRINANPMEKDAASYWAAKDLALEIASPAPAPVAPDGEILGTSGPIQVLGIRTVPQAPVVGRPYSLIIKLRNTDYKTIAGSSIVYLQRPDSKALVDMETRFEPHITVEQSFVVTDNLSAGRNERLVKFHWAPRQDPLGKQWISIPFSFAAMQAPQEGGDPCPTDQVMLDGKCSRPKYPAPDAYPRSGQLRAVCGADTPEAGQRLSFVINQSPCAQLEARYRTEMGCDDEVKGHTIEYLQCVVANSTGDYRTQAKEKLARYVSSTPDCQAPYRLSNSGLSVGGCAIPMLKCQPPQVSINGKCAVPECAAPAVKVGPGVCETDALNFPLGNPTQSFCPKTPDVGAPGEVYYLRYTGFCQSEMNKLTYLQRCKPNRPTPYTQENYALELKAEKALKLCLAANSTGPFKEKYLAESQAVTIPDPSKYCAKDESYDWREEKCVSTARCPPGYKLQNGAFWDPCVYAGTPGQDPIFELGGRQINPNSANPGYATYCLAIPSRDHYKLAFTVAGSMYYQQSLHNTLAECEARGRAWVASKGQLAGSYGGPGPGAGSGGSSSGSGGSSGGSAGGTLPTLDKNKLMTQCDLANYRGPDDDPQFDSFCKNAYIKTCLDKATGTQTYAEDTKKVCGLLDNFLKAVGGGSASGYCSYCR